MYLRSGILSLIIVINMSAVDHTKLCMGVAEIAIGTPFLYWLSIKSDQTSRNSHDQLWERQQELQKMGAKVKHRPEAIKRGVIMNIPSHIKYPKNCSQEDKQKIDKIFEDLKCDFATRFVCGVGSKLLVVAALFVGVSGVIDVCQA